MTTIETPRSMTNTSGAPSARSMLTSFVFHAVALAVLLLVPAEAWRQSVAPKPQVDIVFHRPAPVQIPVPANPLPPQREKTPAGPRPAGTNSARPGLAPMGGSPG